MQEANKDGKCDIVPLIQGTDSNHRQRIENGGYQWQHRQGNRVLAYRVLILQDEESSLVHGDSAWLYSSIDVHNATETYTQR